MPSSYLVPSGDLVSPADLVAAKARGLVAALAEGKFPYVTLVECRRDAGSEIVVVDVEVEVGQAPAADIRRHERLALVFDPQDEVMPRVLALRDDFPWVPHLNLEAQVFPRSLCLFNERYPELKLRLTARGLVERAREWLRLTSRGELHAQDQGLEQFLLSAAGTLIVPHGMVTATYGEGRHGFETALQPMVVSSSPFTPLISVRSKPTSDGIAPEKVMVTYVCHPREHGPIQRTPTTLSDLHELLARGGDDLIGGIRQRLMDWKASTSLTARFALLLLVPLRRQAGGQIERIDRWAFLTNSTLGEIGESVGKWDLREGQPGVLMPIDEKRRGEAVSLHMFNIKQTLSREQAARVSGYPRPIDVNIAAVGCGALGSQLFLNAYRSGFGVWTLVDHDHLLPHNLARHALTATLDGAPKALALSYLVGDLLDGEPGPAAIIGDILRPGEQGDVLKSAFEEAGLILDMSTSIPVARTLALDTESPARRASIFLNPRGTDLVLLLEDASRGLRLDALEMQYYRAVLGNDELANHLADPHGALRYGQSCRDIAFAMSQELVAVHGGIGAWAIRRGLENQPAQLLIWQTDSDTGAVAARSYPTYPVRELTFGEWRLLVDEGLVRKLHTLRFRRLPNETGGVLLGSLDLHRKLAYVVDILPSPPDSKEYPTCYIRGSEGLLREVEAAGRRTGGQIGYIGEWHSHPDGSGVIPSDDDAGVFTWIRDELESDGYPPIMLIAGERGVAAFLGALTPRVPPEYIIQYYCPVEQSHSVEPGDG